MSDYPRTAPCVVHGLDAAVYHATRALSASGLKQLRKSPRHYIAAIERPPVASQAMNAGTLAHCAILEPASLPERYIVKPDGFDGRTKEGKAWLAAVPQAVEAVTSEQMQTAKLQAEAVRALPEVAALLGDGQAEVSAFWIDPQTGVLCKCRPDWVSPAGDGVILLDIKTCQDASQKGFQRTIANYGYHLQDAHYSDGYAIASGKPVLGFVFAAVEAEYPHVAAAYMLDDISRDVARDENRRLAAVYADCMARNEWSGYSDTIQPLALPAWAL